MGQQPRVTVAIPLYRAAPFVDIIRRNIEAIGLPDAEILVSDRHGFDDALEQLRQTFRTDDRVVFLEKRDEIGWVDHYNSLLQRATGRYFMWMPQDDSFPQGYVETLLAALEMHPDTLLSFGQLHTHDLRSGAATKAVLPDRYDFSDRPWRPIFAPLLAIFWNLGVPFRGVFDRKRIAALNLFIRQVPGGDPFADVSWMFAVALHGKLRYVPQVASLKRYHRDNTHQKWDIRNFFFFSPTARRVMYDYVDAAPLPRSAKVAIKLLLAGNGVVRQATEPFRRLVRKLPRQAINSLKKIVGLSEHFETNLKTRDQSGRGLEDGRLFGQEEPGREGA